MLFLHVTLHEQGSKVARREWPRFPHGVKFVFQELELWGELLAPDLLPSHLSAQVLTPLAPLSALRPAPAAAHCCGCPRGRAGGALPFIAPLGHRAEQNTAVGKKGFRVDDRDSLASVF